MSSLRASLLLEGVPLLLPTHATEKDTLSPFPGFDAEEKQERLNNNDSPFPSDSRVLEYHIVDNGYVKDRNHGNKASENRPEEELIAPDIMRPLREILFRFGLHAEERPAHIHHFPGQEQGKPRQADESGCACLKDQLTLFGILAIATASKVAVSESPHHQGEGRKTQS